MLDQVVSVNASVPAPLASILEQFKQPAGCQILIDRPALAAAGISENATGRFKADKLPQGEALGKLLDPLGLAWRAVDADHLAGHHAESGCRADGVGVLPRRQADWPASRRRH